MFGTILSIGIILVSICYFIRLFIEKREIYWHEIILGILYIILFVSFVKIDEKQTPLATEYKEGDKYIYVIKEITIESFDTIKIKSTGIGNYYINLNKTNYEIIYTDKEIETIEEQNTYRVETKKFLFKEYKTSTRDDTFYTITLNKEKRKDIEDLIETNKEYAAQNNEKEE